MNFFEKKKIFPRSETKIQIDFFQKCFFQKTFFSDQNTFEMKIIKSDLNKLKLKSFLPPWLLPKGLVFKSRQRLESKDHFLQSKCSKKPAVPVLFHSKC